jgi:hypothetical protein
MLHFSVLVSAAPSSLIYLYMNESCTQMVRTACFNILYKTEDFFAIYFKYFGNTPLGDRLAP